MIGGNTSHMAVDLERNGIAFDLNLKKLIQEVLRLGFGYTLDGASWRAQNSYGAGVYH